MYISEWRSDWKMKKFIHVLIILVSAAMFLNGCSGSATEAANKGDGNGRLKIYTSFYTMYDFAEKIAGDRAEIVNLVPAGTEPHEWEPSTTDMVNLEGADVLIYNGAGMEHWVEQVAGSLQNNITLVEASRGIELLEGGHSHEDGEGHEEDGDIDPHVWLNIQNAKLELENIKNALAELDSENAQYYEENYKKYAEEFDKLDSEYKEKLSALENKNIVVAHEAFSYLCDAYGLTQTAISGLSADSEPDARRLSQIISFAKENNVKTIFFEELVSSKTADVIANEIKADTKVLNPLEGLSEEQIRNQEDYLSVMKSNLDALEAALNE